MVRANEGKVVMTMVMIGRIACWAIFSMYKKVNPGVAPMDIEPPSGNIGIMNANNRRNIMANQKYGMAVSAMNKDATADSDLEPALQPIILPK